MGKGHNPNSIAIHFKMFKHDLVINKCYTHPSSRVWIYIQCNFYNYFRNSTLRVYSETIAADFCYKTSFLLNRPPQL